METETENIQSESEQTEIKEITLKEFQAKTILSKARYIAMVSGWATGKTLCGSVVVDDESKKYKNNLGLVARRELVDLRDSTIKDFCLYTGMKLNSSREAIFPNGSQIMFRHLEELTENNLKNMNLGFAWFEQAEELKNDRVFFQIHGRLRRCHGCKKQLCNKPNCKILHCICKHKLLITANTNGHNWIYDLWKLGKLENAELIEAKTFDNEDNLSLEFIKSLDIIKKNRPEIYERFVLNSWDVDDSSFVVIPLRIVNECVNNNFFTHLGYVKKITYCDVAGESEEADETVIYNFVNSRIVHQEIYRHRTLMDTVGRIQSMAMKNGSNLIGIDEVGLGAGCLSRLKEIYESNPNMEIRGFDGRLKAPEGVPEKTYVNYKTYAWFNACENYFREGKCSVPNDMILIDQLSRVRYKYTSNGKISLVSKEEIKEDLKCSPDRADAYIGGLDMLQYAKPIEGREVGHKMKVFVHPAFRGITGIGKYQKNPYEGRATPIG